MTKKFFTKKHFLDEKLGKNVIFEAKNHKKFDKMELSWPTEMVDSLKNQKKLLWNDTEKVFWNQKIQMVQNSQKQYFLIKNGVFEQKTTKIR